jgi:hypothetical protein
MISLNYIGLTDEHCWLESRKNALLEWTDVSNFITGLTGEHILSHSVNGNASV